MTAGHEAMNCECDYDGETSAVWDETKPRARKSYKCGECSGVIKAGERYTRISSLYDGTWTTFRRCEDCSVVICDLGTLTREKGGCFCHSVEYLAKDMMRLARNNPGELALLEPIFCEFNAASKERGGVQLNLSVFKP